MAYNVHWGFIAAGASFPVGYLINGGQDLGAQFAQGSPENPGGNLVTGNHGKVLDSNRKVTYWFDLSNRGTSTFYMLEGGGLS